MIMQIEQFLLHWLVIIFSEIFFNMLNLVIEIV